MVPNISPPIKETKYLDMLHLVILFCNASTCLSLKITFSKLDASHVDDVFVSHVQMDFPEFKSFRASVKGTAFPVKVKIYKYKLNTQIFSTKYTRVFVFVFVCVHK